MSKGEFMKLSEMSNNSAKSASSKNASHASKRNLNEAYDELKNLSSDELMQMLAKEIQTQKSNGVFDYDGLMASIDKIKVYLPTQTYENMMRIIESLK